MEEPQFQNPQQEIAYLKKLLEDKQQEIDEADHNFSDFQLFSKQLEDEMEQELQAAEKKYAELETKHKRLKDEHENSLEKMAKISKESSGLIATLQEEVNKLTQTKNNLQKDVRRLEQENDSLERRERMLGTSVSDFQERLEKVIEENVWLQSELDEQHAQADESIQRLRDEIRDLKLEVAIFERKGSTPLQKSASNPLLKTESPLGKRDHSTSLDYSPRTTKSPRRQGGTPGNTSTNSVSAAAIGMVSDMLNLVKELEVRIATYRSNRTLLTPPTSPRTSQIETDSNNDKEKYTALKLSFEHIREADNDIMQLSPKVNTDELDGTHLRLTSSESGSENDENDRGATMEH